MLRLAMDLRIDLYFTLALAAGLLVLGRLIVGRVPLLRRYSIPDAVVGGMLAAALLTAARAAADLRLSFDTALLTPLNVMFFTSVGLMADARSLVRGGRMLLLFFAAVAGALVVQNAAGVALARAFDLHPLNGLLGGSITLAGGHGTGAAWAGKFADERNLQGAVELAVACATFGLVAGGLLGGPLASWLLRRHGIEGSGEQMDDDAGAAPAGPIPLQTMIETLLLVFTAMAVGLALFANFGDGRITLPSFIWALVVGVVLRNALSLSGVYRVDDRAADLVGSIALSLFLSMVIMTLKLWELVDLALPMLAILAVQTALMFALAAFVTFRLMGSNYDAVLLSTGQMGFTLGSTATAMVNMQSVAARHGYSRLAFLLVPVMGAFLIDLANAAVIQGFLWLPMFGAG
jgi:ESS family glutamate:Na+ symporter